MSSALRKYNVLGADLLGAEIMEIESIVANAAHCSDSLCVSSLAVHGLITLRRDQKFKEAVASFDVVVPDGQPVRWLMNATYHLGLKAPVGGTDLMERLCARCGRDGLGIYLYGSTPLVIEALKEKLKERFPRLAIRGAEASLFRPLRQDEQTALAARIRASGARILFLGLGCPRQEIFAAQLQRQGVQIVKVCSGAGFEFIAGTKQRAPVWMRTSGLEWLHRLAKEPRRLAWRYIYTNSLFALLVLQQWIARTAKGARGAST